MMPSSSHPSVAHAITLRNSEPDPRSWFLRPETYEPIRRGLAVCLVCAVAGGCIHTAMDRILDRRTPISNTRGAAIPDTPPVEFSAESLPRGGTVASGYHSNPPYGRIDPAPREPMISLRLPDA